MKLFADQIDIWIIDEKVSIGEADEQRCWTMLSDTEKDRCSRFVFARDRRQYTLARALLRTTLSKYHPQVQPEQWLFEFNAQGKPRVANVMKSTIHFNLSHTQDLIALAVRSDNEVGIDVESLNRDNNLQALSAHCFTEKERMYTESGTDGQFAQRFFTLWTLKESVLKALGTGLSLGLKEIEFTLDQPIYLSAQPAWVPKHWHLHCYWLAQHTMSLAAPVNSQHAELTVSICRSHPLKNSEKLGELEPKRFNKTRYTMS